MSGHARILPTEPTVFAHASPRASPRISGVASVRETRRIVTTRRTPRERSRETVANRTERSPATQEVRNALASAALYSTFLVSTAA
jgi:hypothetical protein